MVLQADQLLGFPGLHFWYWCLSLAIRDHWRSFTWISLNNVWMMGRPLGKVATMREGGWWHADSLLYGPAPLMPANGSGENRHIEFG
mmetsp:Transcript_133402/g.236082  ORF Transcript_133402/g.236082 Transcript_133402/m.236082 type:complete len:87 (+) Transcript_133402:2357-2617(+)